MRKIIFLLAILFLNKVAFATDLATVIEWKYGACAGTKQFDEKDESKNPRMVISYWKCPAPQPDEKQIQIDFSEYEQFILDETSSDDQEASELKMKLKISDKDIDVLAKLVKERL